MQYSKLHLMEDKLAEAKVMAEDIALMLRQYYQQWAQIAPTSKVFNPRTRRIRRLGFDVHSYRTWCHNNDLIYSFMTPKMQHYSIDPDTYHELGEDGVWSLIQEMDNK